MATLSNSAGQAIDFDYGDYFVIGDLNFGCTDSDACNFDATANADDGSCDYSCLGCTDETASNYDPDATVDDGSCVFEELNPPSNLVATAGDSVINLTWNEPSVNCDAQWDLCLESLVGTQYYDACSADDCEGGPGGACDGNVVPGLSDECGYMAELISNGQCGDPCGGGGTTGGGTAAYGSSYANAGATNSLSGFAGASTGGRFYKTMNAYNINAEHVIHMSMSDGLDNLFPFGQSVLEQVFKVYKQKELLEDAIIIYRVQRAPERRVFYVDVGNMPSHLAMQFVERVKTDIHQRRIPSSTGGGNNVIDSAYNPLSINEDYFFPQTAEGRGSKVETLPGGTNLGEIDDLKYFTNKLVRGLRIPSSYLPTGPDDGATQFQDGRVGTAYIQELRFNTYCERLQNLVVEEVNQEFKRYMIEKGINIDTAMFDLRFQTPQNFAAYRQSEIDNARVPTYTQMSAIPYISNRFAMKRFLSRKHTVFY